MGFLYCIGSESYGATSYELRALSYMDLNVPAVGREGRRDRLQAVALNYIHTHGGTNAGSQECGGTMEFKCYRATRTP